MMNCETSARRCSTAPLGQSSRKKTIDELGTGDVLILAEWERRSMMDGVHIIEGIKRRVP
jgi:hypothetical protein